jgi:hypothetical protein
LKSKLHFKLKKINREVKEEKKKHNKGEVIIAVTLPITSKRATHVREKCGSTKNNQPIRNGT